MTAVPDIRQQAEFLAGQLASLVRAPAHAVRMTDATWSI
jgi:hypothetical protein